MRIHPEQHPLANQTVVLHPKREDPNSGIIEGAPAYLEDWADRLWDNSWGLQNGNPTAMKYAMRSGLTPSIPFDEEVVYVKINGLANLVHQSEL